MTFSVLINNYNYGSFIGEAIESVLSQTFGDFELIIVDDGSHDDSREVIGRYGDDRIRKIFKENGGQASALNAGWAETRGKYVALLDSDDRWLPTKLEAVLAALEGRRGVAMLQHRLNRIDREGRKLAEPPVGHWISPGTYDMKRYVLRTHSPPIITVTSGMVAAREAVDRCFPLDEGWRVSADAALSARAVGCGSFTFLGDILGDYRLHGSNQFFGERERVVQHGFDRERRERALVGELNTHSCGGAVRIERGSFQLRRRMARILPGPLGTLVGKAVVKVRRTRALAGARLDDA